MLGCGQGGFRECGGVVREGVSMDSVGTFEMSGRDAGFVVRFGREVACGKAIKAAHSFFLVRYSYDFRDYFCVAAESRRRYW